ncbi:hypothetical protein TSO5_16220 [Azospirillum sp. TSO5]|nr:hypothetical protein TSO5_16220 [Azospirillum sp. TSO5]
MTPSPAPTRDRKMTRRKGLTPDGALTLGVVAFTAGAACLFLALLPPSTGVSGDDPNAAVARLVVESVRSKAWPPTMVAHDWSAARADGTVEVGVVQESKAPGGSVRKAPALLPVSAPPSVLADGMVGAAKRHVQAVLVQRCGDDGRCGPLAVEDVRFKSADAAEALAPEGSIRRTLLEKGKEKLSEKLDGVLKR